MSINTTQSKDKTFLNTKQKKQGVFLIQTFLAIQRQSKNYYMNFNTFPNTTKKIRQPQITDGG